MGCVYVAQGETGLLKVGHTKNFKTRRAALAREFARFGDTLARFEACDEIECDWHAEYGLLRKMAEHFEQYSGREWFASGDFDVVLGMAKAETDAVREKKMAVVPSLPREEVAARIAKRQRERQDQIAAKAAHKIKHAIKVQSRRDLLAKRQMEIAIRLAKKAGLAVALTAPEPTPAVQGA